jgi:hypothetical protein
MSTSTVSLVSADGKRFALAPGQPIRIGRGDDNDLVIPDKSVSRHHATIIVKDGRCLVRDLESVNGTFLAGRKINDATLADGDAVRFGDVEFRLDNPGARLAIVKPWWQSRAIQASAAAAVGAVVLVALFYHGSGNGGSGNDSQSDQPTLASAMAGRSNFTLPQASPDFIGDWSGALPLASSTPPNFSSTPSVDMGVTFYAANGHVVMSIAAYAAQDVKLTKMQTSGINERHVMLEEEALEKDTLGNPLIERDRIDIALASAGQLDCVETHDYYRDPNGAVVAEVIYKGPLGRITAAEGQKKIEEMERQGLKKQGETTAPVLKQ